MLSLERKLQDIEYKDKYDISNNTYEEIRPHLFKNPVITKYISIIKVSSMLKAKEKKNNEAKNSLMDYEKYDISKYILEKDLEKEGGKLNKAILESLENDFSNKHLNIAMFHYETMTYIEVKAYIKLLTKAFYLIDKYKDSDFSREILKYLNTINHYEDFKPEEELDVNKENIKDKIKTEEDLEKLNAQVRYLTLHNKYMEIKNTLTHFLNGGIYTEEGIKSRVECYLTDYFYLYKYKKAIDVFNLLDDEVTKDENITKPLENKLNNVVHEAKSVYKLKNELDDILETKAEEYKVNTSITPKEEKIITDKITEAMAILDKYDYRYLDYLNFNTITYLLAFNKEAKEILKDVNTDLSLENPVKPKEKKKPKKIVDNENDSYSTSSYNKEITTIKVKKGQNTKITPNKASLEEINEAYEKKVKEYYKTGSTPTNLAILDTYGAYSGIETNNLDKINIKIKDLKKKIKKAKTEEDKDSIKGEITILEQKKEKEEEVYKGLVENIESKEENIKQLKDILEDKKDQLSKSEIEQYENTLTTLRTDLIDAKNDLYYFNNRGLAFRGNLFNELEYNDEKGNIVATIRNKDGQPLDPKDTPLLADAFLRVTNDLYFNRYDMLNEYKDKIDVLFPIEKGGMYKIINETIKTNLGKSGFIINVKDLLKLLGLSENSFKYFGNRIEEAIKFYNNMEISVQQKDKITNNEDILNVFFGITSNVHLSRQVDNNYYIYYEISSIYESVLNNAKNPTIAQYPKALLKYAHGQKGNKRVFKVGEKLYTILRESLNGSNGGVKIDEDGHYYKNVRVKDLLRRLRESKLINSQARPRKYREDVFNPLVMALDTLVDEELIKYTLYFDDSVYMSNDTFKTTFETSLIQVVYLKTSEDYENILAKNLQYKKKNNVKNAKDFVLEWGKYKGKTLGEILEEDKQYLEWILEAKDLKVKKPAITKQHVKNLLDYEANKEKLKK